MNDGTNASSFLLYVNDGADDDKNEMITSHPILFRLNYCFIDKDYSDDNYDYADTDRNDASAYVYICLSPFDALHCNFS